jgi:hypothetical protein
MYRSQHLRLWRIIAFGILISGCNKKNENHGSSSADILAYSITGKNAEISIAPLAHFIKIKFPGSVSSGDMLTAAFTLSPGATAAIANYEQVSGVTKNNFETTLQYIVTASDPSSKKTWTVSATNNDTIESWGLGHFLKKKAEISKEYNWYWDQMKTGVYSSHNCGPAVAVMAAKWADSSFSITPEELRNNYQPDGSDWFTYTIDDVLRDNDIPHSIISIGADAEGMVDILTKQLDFGRIIILCLDMNHVRLTDNDEFRTDKFYKTSGANWGHFIILKGYSKVDNEFYFEVSDPYSAGLLNADDNKPKGEKRYYRYEDISSATATWWNYAFVVSAKGTIIDGATLRNQANAASIAHAYGK